MIVAVSLSRICEWKRWAVVGVKVQWTILCVLLTYSKEHYRAYLASFTASASASAFISPTSKAKVTVQQYLVRAHSFLTIDTDRR
jgi:hypothetical protein